MIYAFALYLLIGVGVSYGILNDNVDDIPFDSRIGRFLCILSAAVIFMAIWPTVLAYKLTVRL